MLRVIYDDSAPISPRVGTLIGIETFGALMFRRRTLRGHFRAAVAAAGLEPPIEVGRADDWARLLAGSERRGANRYLVCPSQIVDGVGPDGLALFLRQARHAPGSLLLPVAGASAWSGWLLLTAAQLRDYRRARDEDDLSGFVERHAGDLVRMDDRLALVDLGDEVALLKYLSGTFDVRFFNAIAADDYLLTKTSRDGAKLRREFDFHHLLPPAMRMFFLQPFDFRADGGAASYRMERLQVPDMALQWLHGALSEAEFARFLDRIFHFVDARARRPASPAEARARIDAIYVDKVRARVAELKALPEYAALRPLLERVCGSIDALFDRYGRLFERARRRFPADHLVIGHGDLCFSNILYGKTGGIMKLIDPRGASGEDDLYADPYYDLAKLSHSVLGSYDLINQDMFDVSADEALNLRLQLDRQPPAWARPMFLDALRAHGFDPLLVRLCEASLFVSMLPLHVDRPRKVLGFAINAAAILDEVEAAL